MEHLLREKVNKIILDRVRLVVSQNDSIPAVNEVRLGRSIHYININENILDRVRLGRL